MRRVALLGALLVSLGTWSAPRFAHAESPPTPEELAKTLERDSGDLKRTLDALLDAPPLSRGHVGLEVVDLDSGVPLYSRNAAQLFNPASNVKLFTSAAALSLLGSQFRFVTELSIDPQGSVSPSEVRGNLYVRGTGDPSILNERLFGFVQQMQMKGLRSIAGDLVLDSSYFDEVLNGPGFDQQQGDQAYLAPPAALSLNWNTVEIAVFPGEREGDPVRVQMNPDSPFFAVDNRAQTGAGRRYKRLSVTSLPAGEQQQILVTGSLSPRAEPVHLWKKIDNPALYFGQTFKAYLAAAGILVKGKVRRGTVPSGAVSYLRFQSETLDLLLKRVNKNSSNFTAETLLKTLGAEATRSPGSWENGVAVVSDFLAAQGIPKGAYFMRNGSGLNDTNRFSPHQVTTLLRAMWLQFPIAPEYLSSLGIAGKDGTLASRMSGTDAAGRLRAKTGTLQKVSALSGYVETVSGRRLAFSMMVNDLPVQANGIVSRVDMVGASLAALGASGGPESAAAAVARAARKADALDDLLARAESCEAIGAARNPENIASLRKALDSTRDPAERLLVADAIYRSSPATGARTLVENFSLEPKVWGRLRRLAASRGAPIPGLASLMEVAATGDRDALTRTVELLEQGSEDEALMRELSEPTVEVARSAPRELLDAIGAAPEPLQKASIRGLAQAFKRADEPRHPFFGSLAALAGSGDETLATVARSITSELRGQGVIESPGMPPPAAIGRRVTP